MASPRVFISHSCKDAELAALAPADAGALARRERLAYARTVRNLLQQRLDARGFEVCLDVSRLEPGDEWRAKLHFWLDTCDAAVILLSPEAVASPWVRREVDILMHRWTVSQSFESDSRKRLKVVPVYLGGFSDADIRASGFGDLEILSVQAARLLDSSLIEVNAARLADLAAGALENLTPVTRDSHLRRWLDSVMAGLREVQTKGSSFLDQARQKACVGDADWIDQENRIEILAYHLLHCDLPTVKAALAEIRPAFLSQQQYQAFASRLLPVWVDESSARGLVEARVRVDDDHSARAGLALNAAQFDTVRDYVNRAWSYPSWGGRCIDFDPPLGEGQDAEALAWLKQALLKETAARPATTAILTKYLECDPFFVAIGFEIPASAALLRQMAADYPHVTFVVLGGSDFTTRPDADAVVPVQPPLAAGVEDAAAATKGEILKLQ